MLDTRLSTAFISKEKINNLILNHLIQEGFQNAAEKFLEEAAISKTVRHDQPSVPRTDNHLKSFLTSASKPRDEFLQAAKAYNASPKPVYDESEMSPVAKTESTAKGYSLISKRRRIKYLILKGDIKTAIEVISTYYPTILDSNNLLLFKLLRLNLIEMIRSHKLIVATTATESGLAEEKAFLDEVLGFVRKNLISKVTQSFELLRELEITMSLLCFNFDPNKLVSELTELPDELKHLFDLSLRNDCYRIVNRVIMDLEHASMDTLQYRRQQFADFDPMRLQKLQSPPPLQANEDVEMSYTDAGSGSTEEQQDLDSLVPPRPEPKEKVFKNTVLPNDETKSLDSKLETIAKMWITTERRMIERKLKLEEAESGGGPRVWL